MGKGYYITSLEPGKPRKRVTKWRIRYPTGETYDNGSPKCTAERFEGTYTQAEEYAQSKVVNSKQGKDSLPSSYTVFSYCTKRNESEHDAHTVSDANYEKRRNFLKNVDLHIGNIKLNQLTTDDVLSMLKKLSQGESVSGRPLSGTSCANIRSTLRYFLQCAVDEKLIPFNPVAVTKPPKEDTEERKALSDEQWHFLRSRLNRNDRRELALLILIETGMREEEVCALKWSDVTDDGFFFIHSAMQKNGKPKETKNTSSVRYVKLSPHLRRQLSRAPRHGDYICGYPYNDNHKNRSYGDPLRPNALAKWWRETFRDTVGLSDYSLHEVGRHTTVSQMIKTGVDIKSACALTGQSEITMLRIYAHADKKKASGSALDALQGIRDNSD